MAGANPTTEQNFPAYGRAHTRTDWHTHWLAGWSYVSLAAGGWTGTNCSSFQSCCSRRTLRCLDCEYIHRVAIFYTLLPCCQHTRHLPLTLHTHQAISVVCRLAGCCPWFYFSACEGCCVQAMVLCQLIISLQCASAFFEGTDQLFWYLFQL